MAHLGEALDLFAFAVCFLPHVYRLPIYDPIDEFPEYFAPGHVPFVVHASAATIRKT